MWRGLRFSLRAVLPVVAICGLIVAFPEIVLAAIGALLRCLLEYIAGQVPLLLPRLLLDRMIGGKEPEVPRSPCTITWRGQRTDDRQETA